MEWLSLLLLLHFSTGGVALNECRKCACCKGGASRCMFHNSQHDSCLDGCISGYYSTRCTHACMNNCLLCSNILSCLKCTDGYYGSYCDKCPGNCLNCSSAKICDSCKDGFYNGKLNVSGYYNYYDCRQKCGLGCQNHQCDIDSGSCTCLFNFQGNKCDQCVNGKYGYRCETTCPADCANNSCDVNGNCFNCKTGFTGNMCTQCVYGKYGTDCNIPCPSGCRNENCKANGDCYSCKDGFTESKCDQCVTGKYGFNCEHDCSKNCDFAVCNSTTGVCNNGCRINYHGEQCNMTCATTCLPDDEGRMCFHTNGSCVKDCQNGYHGDMCQDRCSENCININCSRASGACKLGFVGEFEGINCTKQIISDSYNTEVSSNVGAFIGVGVGSVAVTLIVVGMVIIIRRYLMSEDSFHFIHHLYPATDIHTKEDKQQKMHTS